MKWTARIILGVLLLAALGGGVWLAFSKPREPAAPGSAAQFREAAEASGIAFRMNFLPGEQGEKFKVNLYDHGCGLAVGDFDGDGHDDAFFVNQLGACALYRNKGDGTFEDVTKKAGVGLGDRIGVSATFADYDNDGHQDLFVTSTRMGNVLFRNKGDGTFEDVTRKAGVEHVGHCQSGHFFDFDNDGLLDLLVTCTAGWTQASQETRPRYYPGKVTSYQTAASEKEYNLLYRNNGNGTFTRVPDAGGLAGLGWAADAAVFDYDGDGRLDVAMTNMYGRAQLYRNKGDGTFREVTKETLGRTSWGGMGVRPFDFNNDGRLDLFIVDMHSDMWMEWDYDLAKVEPRRKFRHLGIRYEESHPLFERLKRDGQPFADMIQLKPDEVVYGNSFFKNQGQGKFLEMSDRANLETFWPWGIATGDFDNDGFEDVFIPAGMGYPFHYWPNSLMMNQGNETFADKAESLGIEPPSRGIHSEQNIGGKKAARSSRAAAVADFDGDGRLDLLVNNFNDTPCYFRNAGRGGNHLAFRLRGTRSNRDAVGAVVRVHVGEQILTRQVHCASGYLAQSSKTLHFGLGTRDKIDRVEITWPGGRTQTLDSAEVNKLHSVTEPAQ